MRTFSQLIYWNQYLIFASEKNILVSCHFVFEEEKTIKITYPLTGSVNDLNLAFTVENGCLVREGFWTAIFRNFFNYRVKPEPSMGELWSIF